MADSKYSKLEMYAASAKEFVFSKSATIRSAVGDYIVNLALKIAPPSGLPADVREPLKAAIREATPHCRTGFAAAREEYGLILGAHAYAFGLPDPKCVIAEISKDDKLGPLITPQNSGIHDDSKKIQ